MSTFQTARPMARRPRVTARTPLLAQSRVTRTTEPLVQADPAIASQAITNTGTMQVSTPIAVTSGFAHSSQNADAVASQSAASNDPEPTPAELLDATLTLDLRNTVLDVITHTVNQWRMRATFRNLIINAMTVTGTAGSLTGPQLTELKTTAPGYFTTDGLAREVVDMCLRGVSENFALWQHFLFVPGLPLYPAFAAFPGPFAPPMPSVPMPLAMFPSGQATKLTVNNDLRNAMLDHAPLGVASPALVAFTDNISKCCATGFTVFLASQTVTNLLGQGPVPSFKPPMVPIGPVMGGTVIEMPGSFANAGNFSIPRFPMV